MTEWLHWLVIYPLAVIGGAWVGAWILFGAGLGLGPSGEPR